MDEQLSHAIEAVNANRFSFCKFVSPNDAGDTGGHQAGLYIPKNSIKLMFDTPGVKGENKEKIASIKWDDGQESKCRFIYYGKGSRNEYRITRLERHFKVDDLVVIVKENEGEYLGFVFTKETDKAAFLNAFGLTKEDTNSLIPVSEEEHSSHSFRPRARIIKIIGQELISNDVIALVELIKNSYDADALKIEIELNDIFSPNGRIIIKDDGLGMNYDKIINVWLEPATPDKKKGDNRYSKCYSRRLLGEKGIGRFAAHRLGNTIELITRAKIDCQSSPLDYETKVKIDWNSFTDDKYLEDIPITVSKVLKPSQLTENSGTLITISNITPWKTIKNVTDAVEKIRGLESPVKPQTITSHRSVDTSDPGLEISITSNNIETQNAINEVKSLKDLLSTAFYTFKGVIGVDGTIKYKYTFDRPDYQDIKRAPKELETSLIGNNIEWFEKYPLTSDNTPGEFEVSFYAWDLEPSALKIAGLANYYKNIIKPNAGVRIYRDNFRVWPYGEVDNDWLDLDLKRLNAPKERSVSRNQVFGVIHISSVKNAELKDQSNREGLINNSRYEQFYNLVQASLSLFAQERKADKIKIDKITKSNKAKDIVSESIDELRQSLDSNKHLQLYQDSVNKIEKSYHDRVNDILDRYMMAAAIGISYSIPIHEMKLRLTSIKSVIEDIGRDARIEDRYLRELAKLLNDTEETLNAVSSIMSRQKKQKVNLFKVANNAHFLKETDFKKYDIDFEVKGDKSVEVEAVPGLLNTAVLNLVDNAIYWLRAKKIESRQQGYDFHPLVSIEIKQDENNNAIFVVKDNGNGFGDPFELLIEPYYSRKTDGLGLGLYLVNEIMIRQNGRLYGHNDNGAVFTLIFNQ